MIKKTTFLAAMLLAATSAHANANVTAIASHDAKTLQTREVARFSELATPEFRTAGFYRNSWPSCGWGSFYTYCWPFNPRG